MIKNSDPADRQADGRVRPGPTVPGSRRVWVIAIALLALGLVPLLWFAGVVVLWGLGGGDASPSGGPGAAGPAGGAPITQVVFSPDGTLAAFIDVSASSDLTRVKISNAATWRTITTVTDPQGVDAAAISPDDTTLAILDVDGSTYLRDIATGQLTAILPAPGGGGERGQTVAFSPDGKILAVVDASSVIYLWNPAAERVRATFAYPGTRSILGLAFSPDGKTLAIFDNNDHTYVLDTTTGQRVATLTYTYMSGGPSAVAYSPDSTMLATCTGVGVSLWDIATSRKTASWTSPAGCQAAQFSPSGTTLAIGDSNGRVYLRDIAAGRTTTRLTVPGGAQILAVAFSPSGATISAGYLAGDGIGTGARQWAVSHPT